MEYRHASFSVDCCTACRLLEAGAVFISRKMFCFVLVFVVLSRLLFINLSRVHISEYYLSNNNEVNSNLNETSSCFSSKKEAYFTTVNNSVRCQIRHHGTRITYSRNDLWKLKANKTSLNSEAKHNITELGIKKHFRGRRAGKNTHRQIRVHQPCNNSAHHVDFIDNHNDNASMCDRYDNGSYQYYDHDSHESSAASHRSRPRILTPIPRAPEAENSTQRTNKNSSNSSPVPSIFVTNTRSLVEKLDETEVILSQNDSQICVVSETWFHPGLADSKMNIPQYNLFSVSRQKEHSLERGGGVAVYVKNNITSYLITDITVPEELECVWVMVRPHRLPREVSAIAVCAVYIPPDSPVALQNLLVDHLLEATDSLRTSYPDIGFVIAGDFNKSRIDRLLFGNQLKQLIKFPTRKDAILDLVFTNFSQYYNEPICLPPIAKSDHNCIVLKPCSSIPGNKIKKSSVRSFKDSNLRSFGTWIQNHDWDEVMNTYGVQAKTDTFYAQLNDAIETHFPLVTVKHHESDKPWITQKIKNLIRERQTAFIKGNTTEWKFLRNKIKRLIEQTKMNYYAERVRHLQKTDSKNWHRQVKVMTRNCSNETCIQVPGVQANRHNEIANVINCKFVDVSAHLEPLDNCKLPSYLPARSSPPCLHPWNVYSVLKKINASKATGPDGIPPRLVKEFAYELSVPLTDILNSSYTEGTVPHQWKKAIVIPIPKQYPANIDKLRPVSLTDCFAKISEGFVVDWILDDIQHKIDPNQYGNVKGVSTSHYLVSLIHFLHTGANLSKNVGTVVVTDFSKAFDLIDHNLLISKFVHIGVRESLIPWICSFISGRQQCVRYNQTLSDYKNLNGGLPQGTKMGPLGFQIIINDAASEADASVWKYVDDLSLASNVSYPTKSTLQKDLDSFVDWSKNNNLTLNPSKCQGLQVCFMNDPPAPTVSIDDVPLQFVKFAKILGIWIQDDLKWDKQINEMLKKNQ